MMRLHESLEGGEPVPVSRLAGVRIASGLRAFDLVRYDEETETLVVCGASSPRPPC